MIQIGDKIKLKKEGFKEVTLMERLCDVDIPKNFANSLIRDGLILTVEDFGHHYSPNDVRVRFPNDDKQQIYQIPAAWFIRARWRANGHHLTKIFKYEVLDKSAKI